MASNSEILAHYSLLPQAKNEQLSISIEDMIDKFDRSSEHLWRPYQELICIRRVHEKLHKTTEPSSYAPLLVSVGPFHRGKESLKAMEECKLHYMRKVLNRTREERNFDSMQRVFKNCVASIGEMEENIRQCYLETINLESKELIEMMVVDGLFIIGIFEALPGTNLIDDKFLFNNIWGKNTLLWDLLLMENQIPIFVLESLFNLTADHKNNQGCMSFQGFALNSFKDNIELPRKINTITNLQQASPGEGNKHLLDLIAKSMHPDTDLNNEHVVQINPSLLSKCTAQITKLKAALLQVFTYITPNSSHNLSGSVIPSATELSRAGVTFAIGPDDGSFLDVKFVDGVMRIPRLVVGINTGGFFRNLIASEQYLDRNGSPYYMTSYAIFMDNLVSSPADVTLLRNQGIITHTLGTDDDVCNIFNKLCSDIYLKDDYYADIHKRVNKYYCNPWNFCKATLRRTYFDNPWAGIYLVAATLYLILSLIGVIIKLLGYIKPKNYLSYVHQI